MWWNGIVALFTRIKELIEWKRRIGGALGSFWGFIGFVALKHL